MVGSDAITYNTFLTYRFERNDRRSWLRHTTIRVGVNNLFDAEPPISNDNNTYETALFNTMAKGRTYSLTFTRTF
jgi:outer membrane receptor protein involved in Fe transport